MHTVAPPQMTKMQYTAKAFTGHALYKNRAFLHTPHRLVSSHLNIFYTGKYAIARIGMLQTAATALIFTTQILSLYSSHITVHDIHVFILTHS